MQVYKVSAKWYNYDVEVRKFYGDIKKLDKNKW